MAYRWPDKDPDETLDFSVDWSRVLTSDTLSSAKWFIKESDGTKNELADAETVEGLQFVNGTVSGKVATARFSQGTNNKRYTVVCQITTGGQLVFERDIHLRVKEK